MNDYDTKYLSFIPLWWGLPTQIASLYCSLMATQLDEQLTQHPESHTVVVQAKEKARDFEKELMDDAMKRLTMIEIDVRSWGKGDAGDSYSWIRIDNKDKRLPGRGIGCVCVDIYNKTITLQKTFDTHGKKLEMNKEFSDFLKFKFYLQKKKKKKKIKKFKYKQ
ncbi:hypothetical protein RFI_08107 [Reticulomyxa filosa]|uniref:Uncharacterized protein n=1 Tax=Reticulomyxa filosa TaxID=46433 RepID=X6NSU9_RETFI|nr:hypothetical protein RFI_08107 [Reticulomyxa filosa]|eukprot:ETO29018.1 hypothetical protein RFI_08107 [Reticulomyxa filosa]